jgi:hemin uptake protein HemP
MDNKHLIPAKPAPRPRQDVATPDRRALTTHELFGSCQEIAIVHDGEEYRLRITRNNKLILTK